MGIQMSKGDISLTVGHLNSEISENESRKFCDMYHLHNLVKNPTCYENENKM